MQHPADALQARIIIKDALQVSMLATRNMSSRESRQIIEKISVHAQLKVVPTDCSFLSPMDRTFACCVKERVSN
jgi:hypothetical protein